ncbi:hypothetical protein M404DRAFT_119745, partial [Pisolithus tinctorius Marx 270]
GVRIECDWLDLTITTGDGQYMGNCIVGCISLDSNRSVWGKMGEDQGRGEGLLEFVERLVALLRKIPGSTFACQLVENELVIKIGEAQEGLNVLYLLGLRPVTDSFDFL